MTEFRDDVRIIGCDESGSEGETLIASQHPVFVHASVNLSVGEASDLRNWMRDATRTQAAEMKSKTALLPRNRHTLLEALDRLTGAVNISGSSDIRWGSWGESAGSACSSSPADLTPSPPPRMRRAT